MLIVLRRTIILMALTLVAGISINQFYPDGIRWALLKPQFAATGSSKILYISADSALSLHLTGNIQFVDVRTDEEYSVDHISGAISIPLFAYYRYPEKLNDYDRKNTMIIYCFDAECPEAKTLAQEFINHHFPSVMVLFGGFSEWLEHGYPIEQPL